ncbi:hypothetical protein GW17_00059054, partial [Ensete ventricosum]
PSSLTLTALLLPCAGDGAARRRRGQPPRDRRCCPRAVQPCVGVALAGVVALASGSPGRVAAPCGLVAGSRPSNRREIVYPCIPDPDGEDEGGQASSSSLAVSTRWISASKLLQSDLATLAQREGEE